MENAPKKTFTPKNIMLTSVTICIIGCGILWLADKYDVQSKVPWILGFILFGTPFYCMIIGGIINARKSQTLTNNPK